MSSSKTGGDYREGSRVLNALFRCLPGCFAAISAVFLPPELSAVQGAHMALGPRAATNFNRNRLKLGAVFLQQLQREVIKVPERWDACWENNLKLAQMANRCGLQCIVPVELPERLWWRD